MALVLLLLADSAAEIAAAPLDGPEAAASVASLAAIASDESEPSGVRTQALLKLGRIGEPAAPAVPTLVALADRRDAVGDAALKALTMLSTAAPAAAALYQSILERSDDRRRRDLAIEGTVALAEIDSDSRSRLRQLLDAPFDREPTLRAMPALPPNLRRRYEPQLRRLSGDADLTVATLATSLLPASEEAAIAAAELTLRELDSGRRPTGPQLLVAMGPIGVTGLKALLVADDAAVQRAVLMELPPDRGELGQAIWERLAQSQDPRVAALAAARLPGAERSAVAALAADRETAVAVARILAARPASNPLLAALRQADAAGSRQQRALARRLLAQLATPEPTTEKAATPSPNAT